MTISKISNILLYVLMGISVIFAGLLFFGGNVAGTAGTPLKEPLITDEIIVWSMILIILTGAAAIIFPLIYAVLNPRNTVKMLIILGIVGLLVFISYQLASNELLNLVGYTGKDNNPTTLKLSDTGLILTYILAATAFLFILYTEISKLFK
jgi:hypothetical protein